MGRKLMADLSKDTADSRARMEEAKSSISHIHTQMREDFRFSDPSNPEQWDQVVRSLRERDNRPCMTFDQTNQYLLQVINDGRQNKPSIKVRGVDSDSDPKVAEALQGIIYHIEDTSRAGIAYDTALEHAARVGLGWIRIVPEIVNPERNEQELRIKRCIDPFAITLEDWTEPDGSDSMAGWVESKPSLAAFKRMFPGKKPDKYSKDSDWCTDDWIKVVEEFVLEEDDETRYVVAGPSMQRMDLSEDEYAQLVQQMGQDIPFLQKYTRKNRSQTWRKFCGDEVLEETTFAADHIPLIPVIGNESWIDGKRYLCGMVRRMMDPARAYNYERSAYIETVALQPKAPFVMSREAAEGYEEMWAEANSSNLATLYFNERDADGQPVTGRPARQSPPTVSTAFVQGASMARDDLQASIGMYRSNLGAPSNAVSGRAKLQDQREGDTATWHYNGNLALSIQHVGRIIVQALPAYYDTKRVQRILGEDGESSQVIVDPNMDTAMRQQPIPQAPVPGQPTQPPKMQLVINPNVGNYDVSISTGPSYSTRRQETSDALAQMIQGNPQMFGLVGDVLAKMQDWPMADKIAARLHAMLPPQVLAAENQDDPQAAAMQQHVQQLTQQLQQAQQQLQGMQQALGQKQNDAKMDAHLKEQSNNIAAFSAWTARLGVLVPSDPALAAALYQSTLRQAMMDPSPDGSSVSAMPPGMPGPNPLAALAQQAAQAAPQPNGPSGPSSIPQPPQGAPLQ